MPIQAVIFDLGGVIVRTVDQSARQALADRLGITREQLYQAVFDSETARLATVGKVTGEAHWEAVCRALGLPPEELEPLKDEFWGGDFVDMELVDYLRSLRPKYKTALLSNAWPNLRKVLARTWKIMDAFDEVVISGEEGIAKPHPQIFRTALDRLGVDPAEAVFVDDLQDNIQAADALGLHAIRFTSPQQALADLEKLLHGN